MPKKEEPKESKGEETKRLAAPPSLGQIAIPEGFPVSDLNGTLAKRGIPPVAEGATFEEIVEHGRKHGLLITKMK